MLVQAQTLYAGNAKEEGVSFRGWGSGLIRETDELAPEVARTIRISSRNFYQGGLIRFSKPTSMAPAVQDKDNLLRFTVKFPGTTVPANQTPVTAPVRGGEGGDDDERGGGGTQSGRGGAPNGAGRGNPFGGAFRGGPPAQVAQTTGPTPPAYLRLVVTTTDGKKSEAYVEIPAARAKTGGWVPVAVPLQAIQGFLETNKEILSVLVSSDAPCTMFIREIGVTKDETPIYADMSPNRDLNLAFGDEYSFTAAAYGGATQLQYMWNFDAANTKGVDAYGRVVKRRFRKPGQYVVQLTVADVYGFKKPFTRSITVTVNP